MAFGEGLMMIGMGVFAAYPIVIAIVLDVLIVLALLKEGGNHPGFLTGFLLGSMSNNRHGCSSSSGSNYIALAILAPLNAGLAVLLCLYLGMHLPLALMICLGPLAGGLAFIVIGAIIEHIDFGQAGEDFIHGAGNVVGDTAQKIADNTKSLWNYLAEKQMALGIGLFLSISLVVGVTLLFHFGLPFYAYVLGFATVGALILLSLGYIAKFAFDAAVRKEAERISANCQNSSTNVKELSQTPPSYPPPTYSAQGHPRQHTSLRAPPLPGPILQPQFRTNSP